MIAGGKFLLAYHTSTKEVSGVSQLQAYTIQTVAERTKNMGICFLLQP